MSVMDEEKAWMHNWLDAVSLNERINGGITTGCLPDNDDDSLPYDDQDVNRFTDSSSDEYDHKYDDYLYKMAGEFRRRTSHSGTVSSSSHTERKPEKPDWFIDRPFQYHGRVCMVSLPGIVIALLLGGEMLLFVACLSGLVIYILQTSGYQESSLTVYTAACVFLTAFVCFTAFPLVWISVYHFVLVVALTLHTSLTGAWLILLFPSYRKENPLTAVYIEYLLFTLYPFTGILLVLWLSAMVSSVFMAVYAMIGCSYVIIQNFFQPTEASFTKPPKKQKDCAYIVTTSESLLLSVCYSLWPSITFVTAIAYKKQVMLSTGIELIFLVSICGFLCVMTTTEYLCVLYQFPQSCVWFGKAGCVLVAVVTLPAVLHSHGYHSSLALSLPPTLLIHAALGYVVIHRKSRSQTLVFILGGGVLAVYTLLFFSLPWTAQLYISGGLDVRLLFVLVYISLVLSVECVIAYVVLSVEEFGVCFLVQTVVFSSTEKILEYSYFLPSYPCICVSVVAVCVICRLYQSRKIQSYHMCLCGSFHCASALTSLTSVVSSQATNPLIEYTVLLCLLVVLSRCALVAEDYAMTTKQVLYKAVLIGAVVLLNIPLWISHMLQIVLSHEPSYMEYFCFVILTQALLCLYLSSKHGLRVMIQLSMGLLLTAAVIAFVQPSVKLSWDSVVKWMVFSSILLVVLLTQITKYLKRSCMLSIVFSFVTGLPLGISLSSLIFPSADELHHICVSVLSQTLILLSLFVWLGRSDMEDSCYRCLWAAAAEVTVGICLQVALGYTDYHLSVVLLFTSVSTVAVICKLHSLRKEALRLTRDGDLKVSKLPLIGNICTVATFVMSFYFTPVGYWNWCFIGSLVLFLLQEDHIALRSPLRDNNVVPTIFVMCVTLVFSSWYHSSAWTPGNWTLRVGGVLEIVVIILTLPVFLVLCTVLWNGFFYISDYYVALVTPLFSILFLTGSSLYAYCLSGVGLSTGYWLLTEKLPLLR